MEYLTDHKLHRIAGVDSAQWIGIMVFFSSKRNQSKLFSVTGALMPHCLSTVPVKADWAAYSGRKYYAVMAGVLPPYDKHVPRN